jgi:hypothetical protein
MAYVWLLTETVIFFKYEKLISENIFKGEHLRATHMRGNNPPHHSYRRSIAPMDLSGLLDEHR